MAKLEKIHNNNFTTTDNDALFLDNDEHDRLTNNLLASAQNLKLNTTPIFDLEAGMNGTESSQILIDQWHTVNDLTNQFRNFLIDDVHPTLINVKSSINNTADDISDSLDFDNFMSLDFQNINTAYTLTSIDDGGTYDLDTLKEKAQDYEANQAYFTAYMAQLNSVGSANWTDEDYEAISIIMDLAITNNNTILLNSALSKFTYKNAVKVSDAWGATNYTYELGVDNAMMTRVLSNLDWKTQGTTYSTLSRIANVPSDTVKVAYYKSDGKICSGYTEPFFKVYSYMEDGELKISISSNNESYKFKTVNMYEKLGSAGVANLKSLGFTDAEICQYANSIFTKEDIQFVSKLGKAVTDDDYYAVAQIDPDKLSDSGKAAFAMYGSQLFDRSFYYAGDTVVETSDGVQRLIAFSNGMFIKREDGGRYETDPISGSQIWLTDSTSYGAEYYLLASSLASMQLDQSTNMLNTYLNLDNQVTDEQLSEIAEQLGISLDDAREQYESNSNSLLYAFNDIQQNNYDYLTYLAGLYNFDVDAVKRSIIAREDVTIEENEFAADDVAGVTLTTINFSVSSNGRLSISYEGKQHSKVGYEDTDITSSASEKTGEQLDDIDKLEDYYKAVENYKKKLMKAGFDTVALVADEYLAVGELGVAAIKIIGALAQGEGYDALAEGSNIEINNTDFDAWVAGMVNGTVGTSFSNMPVASTYATVAGSFSDIIAASAEVDAAYFKLMREWNQDGIVVNGASGSNQMAYVGAYNPETIYKWNAVKRDGLSVMCCSADDIANGEACIKGICDSDIDNYLSGSSWDGYTTDEKREILLCIWNGEAGDIEIQDLTSDQFISAVGLLEDKIDSNVEFDDTAVGDTFSERLSNWEV